MEYVYDGILYHDGQKGMHWGVRKYRNYDGTLTPAGKARYNYGDGSSGSSSSHKISRREARKQRKLESARQAKKESEKAAKEAKEALKALKKEQKVFEKIKKKEEPITAKKLSDAELREAIDRLTLEKQYNALVSSQKINRFSIDYLSKALPVAMNAFNLNKGMYYMYKEVSRDKK